MRSLKSEVVVEGPSTVCQGWPVATMLEWIFRNGATPVDNRVE